MLVLVVLRVILIPLVVPVSTQVVRLSLLLRMLVVVLLLHRGLALLRNEAIGCSRGEV